MDKFDEKVIGYESTKDILRQILDILKRPEVYKRKGISIPRGLLMESDPGLGKSLLASILMEESERKPFVFRKTSQENSFLDELRAVFAMAKEDAPSILLLEDLNLYVESTSPYAPEWACLQACIDDAKDTDLFVIATTNDTRYMPPFADYLAALPGNAFCRAGGAGEESGSWVSETEEDHKSGCYHRSHRCDCSSCVRWIQYGLHKIMWVVGQPDAQYFQCRCNA